MPADKYYVPGTFYRICDRTGMKTRSYRTQKEWNGLIVRDQVWEARQPQDFVKGVPDNQTVPEARPRPKDVFLGVISTTVTADYGAGDNSIAVASVTGMTVGDKISIMLDTNVTLSATITAINPTLVFGGVGGLGAAQFPGSGPSAGVLVFTPVLPYHVTAGNTVIDITAAPTVTL